MENRRQQRIISLLQQEIGNIFLRNSQEWFDSRIITISYVTISSDLDIVKVYLSSLDKDYDVVKAVNQYYKRIKILLNRNIKNQMRFMPTLRFYKDNTQEELENIDKLLKSIQ